MITNINNTNDDVSKETISSSFNVADYFFISFQIAKERYHYHYHYCYHYYKLLLLLID